MGHSAVMESAFRVLVVLLMFFYLPQPYSCLHIPQWEKDPRYWLDQGRSTLQEALHRPLNTNVARNVILFLGDGMSISTVTAARILKGQLKGRPGEETKLAFETFPSVAFSKTYTVDHQVADSAATATAFLCGVKSIYGTLGLNAYAKRGNCKASRGRNVTCIAELAQKAGKMTGFVTTSRVTHATPAPLYACTPDRMWEDDASLPPEAKRHGCKDIASQLLDKTGKNLNVVMGGGRGRFLPISFLDPEHPEKKGTREDGRNLIEEWLKVKWRKGQQAEYIWNKNMLDNIDVGSTQNIIGLFEYDHMHYENERSKEEPSLGDMVEKSINIMQKNDQGYFLLVEGARIDHGHHYNRARIALEETLALEEAVRRTLDLVNLDDTLIIVTADHSHPLSIGSFATRGNPILGLTDYSDEISPTSFSDLDYLPYTTLVYGNGPGYEEKKPRRNLTNVDTTSRNFMQSTAVPLRMVTHEGSDVAIYATGPMSHLFHSTHEQNYIFTVMTYAACLGEDTSHCHKQTTLATSSSPSIHMSNITTPGGMIILLLTVNLRILRIFNQLL